MEALGEYGDSNPGPSGCEATVLAPLRRTQCAHNRNPILAIIERSSRLGRW